MNNKKSFLTTIVETSFLIWMLKSAAAGLVQAVVFCVTKKRLDSSGDKKQ